MADTVVGWDVGGAHLKAAVLRAGCVQQVYLQPCPLWRGVTELQQALAAILPSLPQRAQHVMTMTGELADGFSDREHGVSAIITTMQQSLGALHVFAGNQGFMSAARVTSADTLAIASANWLASAYFTAQQLPHGLFIDIGSTTTDILLLNQGTVLAQGLTDYSRLASGELLYTGIVRTPVMAVAQQAWFNGRMQGLMAEYFATMADVYRLTGELCEAHDHTPTADGAEKSLPASARRLARLTGYDFHRADMALWQKFATTLRTAQLTLLTRNIQQQLARGLLPKATTFIGAGIGRFLVKTLAQQLGYAYRDFDSLIQTTDNNSPLTPADCAPAVAIAALFAINH